MSSSGSVVTWIQWFCSLQGNEFFCEVDEDYISDQFNLTGLGEFVPDIKSAIDKVLDYEEDDSHNESGTINGVERHAAQLYGLVHARYILTNRGLSSMLEKWNDHEFGTCPRVLCNEHPLLPIGLHDVPAQSMVKMYCSNCEDIYQPKKVRHQSIDGAYFGRSFPEMMMMVHPECRKKEAAKRFEPKLYGFKIHPSVQEQ